MRGVGVAVAAFAIALTCGHAAFGQPKVPRTSYGRPDLTGVWSNASVTPLNRPPGQTRLAVTREEAEKIARAAPMVRLTEADAGPADVSKAPPSGGDPGGYNMFWMDAGNFLAQVRGEYRTSAALRAALLGERATT